MKAVILQDIRDISVSNLAVPQIRNQDDAIVKVNYSAICGADLLPYNGHTPGFEFGMTPGHEFVGVVAEIGNNVRNLEIGDRVVNTSMTSCGTCKMCQLEMWTQCETRSLFGYSGVYQRLEGGQAQFVRVPHASRCLMKIPDNVSDTDAIFIADILPTGFAGVDSVGVKAGDLVVVQGAGPVGLMAVMVALQRGAKVVAVDDVQNRLNMAKSLGAITCNPNNILKLVKDISNGIGADSVIEASGSSQALAATLDLARPQGSISVVGAHFEQNFPLNNSLMFEKELLLKFNIGNPYETREMLMALVSSGDLKPSLVLDKIISVDKAKEAYELFNDKKYIKIALDYS